MKTFLPLSRLSILLTVLMTASAAAQVGVFPGGAYTGEAVPGVDTAGAFDPSASRSRHFLTRLATSFPGNVWFRYTGASEGLGYDTGGFFTLGAKTRLGNDLLDGRWMFEARGHLAHEQGQVFANIGVERVFTITPAKADVGFNLFFDADGDASQNFGHDFYGVGVGGFLRHEKFEVRANGYIPVGTTGYRLGTPEDCFFLNYIIEQPGIDTALRGADLELSLRPWHWQMLQGHVDVGGYYYQDADERLTGVGSFGGVRVRGRVTTNRGVSVEAEYNYDERFKATIIGRIVISTGTFGQFSRLGRDLDPTIRNDHVVRWHQDVTFVIDPDTGLPYYVNHVDNTAAPGGDGTVERPFDSLADVDPLQGGASSPDDIILVSDGDGTSTGYDAGITLQPGQLLLGDGFANPIPTVGGRTFLLCNPVTGNKPLITNSVAGMDVVTLMGRNTVAGIQIDGENVARDGITGTGIMGPTVIRDNCILNMVRDGIRITTHVGDLSITDNEIDNVGGTAVNLSMLTLPAAAAFDVSRNDITMAGLGGINASTIMTGGTTFLIDTNTVTTTGTMDGIRLTGIIQPFGDVSNTYMITGNMVMGAGGDGIELSETAIDTTAADTVVFSGNTVTGSGGNGIFVSNFRDQLATHTLTGNMTTTNTRTGILYGDDPSTAAMEGYDGLVFDISGNTSSSNVGNGMFFDSHIGEPAGRLVDFNVITNTTSSNVGFGFGMNLAHGDVDLTNHTAQMNAGDGARFTEVSTPRSVDSVTITSAAGGMSLLNMNNVAGTSAVFYRLNGMNLVDRGVLTVTTTDLSDSGNMVRSIASGAGTTVETMVTANIMDRATNDAVQIQSLAGASHTAVFSDNGGAVAGTLDMIGTISGSGIEVVVDDMGVAAAVSPTEASITMANMTFTNPGGDGAGVGVVANVTGDSQLMLDVDSISVTGGTGSGIVANFMGADSRGAMAPVSTVDVRGSTFSTQTLDGIELNTGANKKVDFLAISNTITNPGRRGVSLIAAAGANLTRANISGNMIMSTNDASMDGVHVVGGAGTRIVGDITGNTVSGMGFDGTRVYNVAAPPATTPAWISLLLGKFAIGANEGRGISVATSGTFNGSIVNNGVTDSALEGIMVQTNGAGVVNVDVNSNGLGSNDAATIVDTNGATAPNPPPLLYPTPLRDFLAQTNGTGTMCMIYDNNGATLLQNTDENAGTTMSVAEGTNTAPGLVQVSGAFTPVAPGVCTTLITTERVDFVTAPESFPP